MSQPQVLITGAGTGIGRALAIHAANAGNQVLGIGRRIAPLEETKDKAGANMQVISADITKATDRDKIKAAFSQASLQFLVHNAAVLEPVAKLEDINAADWHHHLDINLHAPLFLTQTLLPHFTSPARILSISSGAAHSAYPGWTAYCTGKAALAMLTNCMDVELKARGIRAGNAAPGVVDTPMQGQVRESDPNAFPNLQRFLDLKANDQLTDPAETARFMWHLLTEADPEAFASTAWDIRQHWT